MQRPTLFPCIAITVIALSAMQVQADGIAATTGDSRESISTVPLDDSPSFVDRLDEFTEQSRAKKPRWFLAEYDFDSRGFNVLHFMGSSSLPYGFDLWGFIDIEGADRTGADREDLSQYFLEIDLKRKLWNNGGFICEYNDLQGEGNEIGRLGVFYQPKLDWLSPDEGPLAGAGRVGFKVFPLETDGHGWQASFNWNKSFDRWLGGRLSAGGFFDLNVDAGAAHDDVRIVTEHQVRVRIGEGFHAIVEFRVNEFLQDDFGVAPGIQYRF